MKRGTPEHPKTAALSDWLGVPLYAAVGILEMLWHFTAKFTPQGDIGKYTDAAIAAHIGWDREPRELISALTKTGWVEKCNIHRLLVHDWAEHADQTVKRVLSNRKLDFAVKNASTELASASTVLASQSQSQSQSQSHKPDVRSQYLTDQSLTPLREVYEEAHAATIPEDWHDLHWYLWRKLDFEQKLARVKAARERLTSGAWSDPTFIPRPRKFCELEWKRQVVKPKHKTPAAPIPDTQLPADWKREAI